MTDHRHVVAHLTAYRGGEPLPTLITVADLSRRVARAIGHDGRDPVRLRWR